MTPEQIGAPQLAAMLDLTEKRAEKAEARVAELEHVEDMVLACQKLIDANDRDGAIDRLLTIYAGGAIKRELEKRNEDSVSEGRVICRCVCSMCINRKVPHTPCDYECKLKHRSTKPREVVPSDEPPVESYEAYASRIRRFDRTHAFSGNGSTLYCSCGATFTWCGTDDRLRPWVDSHHPHLNVGTNQSNIDGVAHTQETRVEKESGSEGSNTITTAEQDKATLVRIAELLSNEGLHNEYNPDAIVEGVRFLAEANERLQQTVAENAREPVEAIFSRGEFARIASGGGRVIVGNNVVILRGEYAGRAGKILGWRATGDGRGYTVILDDRILAFHGPISTISAVAK